MARKRSRGAKKGKKKAARKVARKVARKAPKKAVKRAATKPPEKAAKKIVRRAAKSAPKTPAALPAEAADQPQKSASELISARIEELKDWRGEVLRHVRQLIREADPEIIEEWKWGVPVWSRDGIICTGETYKQAVKLTFAKGAAVPDPAALFNSSLEGNTRRALDIPEGAAINESAFKDLIRAAVAVNQSGKT